MYATVTTWRVPASVNASDERTRLVHDLFARGIEQARRAGVLDVLMIEVEPDLLMAVSVFETLDEATAARPGANRFIDDRYAGKLEFVSSATGPAFDPRQLAGADRLDVLEGREADVMNVSLVTWRLDSELQSNDALHSFLHDLWERYAAPLHRLGLIDVLVIRIADDAILAVRLYADQIEGNPDYQKAVTAVEEILTGKVEFIGKQIGRAFDASQLAQPGS